MYTSTWTVQGLKSGKDIRGVGGVFLLLVGFLWFFGVFFVLVGFFGGLCSALDSCAQCQLMLQHHYFSIPIQFTRLRDFFEIPFGWKLIMHCFL